jgi:hypothetical protein
MSFDFNALDGFRIILPVVGQKEMRLAGPMVPASWYITAEHERELQLAGKPLPQPIQGFMLLDTGAAHIGIDIDVAKQLGVEPMGETKDVHGIKGYESIDHYLARLLLPIIPVQNGRPLTTTPVSIGNPVEAWGLDGIMNKYLGWGYKTQSGEPLKVIGVLGRIFLQFTTFTYRGLTGETDIDIDKSVMNPKRD